MPGALAVALHGAHQDGVARAESCFVQQGFVPGSRFSWRGGSLELWAHPSQKKVNDCFVRTPFGEACCIGPLWFRGQFGRAALRPLLEEYSKSGSIDEHVLRGNFALFVRTAHHCVLMNDPLGLVKIYASGDGQYFSTSWLASCAYAGCFELDEPAAIEYVLLGASHSDQTVAQTITTLPFAQMFDLDTAHARERMSENRGADSRRPATIDEAVCEIGEHLETVCKEIAAAFPKRIRTALSGGFDSRLILAGLLAADHRPELFVYGSAGAADVTVATAVANELRLPIDVVDKSDIDRRHKMPDLQRLVDSALFFDGLPTDGVFDLGSDQQTRLRQTAGGFIALNGGGGEIFRNFFHLPDRPFRADDIVRTFYRGFDSRVFRRAGGLAEYTARLTASMQRALGTCSAAVHGRMSREQVELLYPLVRCRHWMGVNNSVAIRHGYFATPLLDRTTLQLASHLPLEWKNAGQLESRLIAQLHSGVAGQMSSYGFRFSDGPDRHARRTEMATCMRPVFTRPFINAFRRRIDKAGVAPHLMQHCRAMLPGDWRLDAVLDLTRLPDDNAFARALAVELACRELAQPTGYTHASDTERQYAGSDFSDRALPVP